VPESLESLNASFARRLRAEGKAERTRILYRQSVTYFGQWLAAQNLPADLSGLTRDNVLDWLSSMRERGLTAGTVRTRWRGLHRFCRWLVSEEVIDKDPLTGVVVDSPEPTAVPILSDGELAALINACKGRDFIDLRDAAMIRLMLDCGLRVSELTGIDEKDLDLDAESIAVMGKGSRQRLVYFSAKTGLALDRYLRVRRGHRDAADPALFLGERGRFTPDGVRRRMKVRARKAGLDPDLVHPHMLRHTAAHDWLLNGGQERDLMRLMGWRSEAMLSRYGATGADLRAMQAARRLRRGDRI
jgi:site-specific recombinase XerD